MKPFAPVPAPTIPHPLGPVPKQFPVRGDPSAPGSPLLRTLELGSGEALISALISQSEPENKRVGGQYSGRQALSSAKERLGDKMGRADPCTSLLGERGREINRPSLPPSAHRGAPEILHKPLER